MCGIAGVVGPVGQLRRGGGVAGGQSREELLGGRGRAVGPGRACRDAAADQDRDGHDRNVCDC